MECFKFVLIVQSLKFSRSSVAFSQVFARFNDTRKIFLTLCAATANRFDWGHARLKSQSIILLLFLYFLFIFYGFNARRRHGFQNFIFTRLVQLNKLLLSRWYKISNPFICCSSFVSERLFEVLNIQFFILFFYLIFMGSILKKKKRRHY